ncbi:MAG: hypothetical protein GXX93_11520 [Anaerolineae bacterium]|nr:hypothetical protein [Anaerolineae bacterium]
MLLGAFAVFCVLAVGLPWAALRFVEYSTVTNHTEISTVSGISQLRERGQSVWLAVSGSRQVAPGSIVQTDTSGRSMLTIREGDSDFVLATVHIFGSTQFTVEQSSKPRFSHSDQPNRVVISLSHGRLRLNPGPSPERELDLRVLVPSGEVVVYDGSVALEVTADSTEIAVRGGRSLVRSDVGPEELVLETGERAVILAEGEMRGPMESGRNLLVNGDFGAGLALAWETYNDQGGDGGSANGQALLLEDAGRRVLHLERLGNHNDHCETGVRQTLNRDVTDYVSLRIRVDLRLLYQSLSGGGIQGSEFPVIIRLNYRDARGNLQWWYHGFFYENPGSLPTPNGELIERNVWFAYESPNLMAVQGDLKPAYLESVQVYASGHDYQSQVADVQLVVD